MMCGLGQTATDASIWQGFVNWLEGGSAEPVLAYAAPTSITPYTPYQTIDSPASWTGYTPPQWTVATPAAPTNEQLADGDWSAEQMYAETGAAMTAAAANNIASTPTTGNPCPSGQSLQADGTCGQSGGVSWLLWGLLAAGVFVFAVEVGNEPKR